MSSSDARAINNAGQVAGSDTGASGTNAVIWNGTTPTSLGPGFANSINSFGTAAGANGTGSGSQAVVWNGTTRAPLGFFSVPGFFVANVGLGTNDSGQVAGIAPPV